MIDVVIAIEDAGANRQVHDVLRLAADAVAEQTATLISEPLDIGHEVERIIDWLQTYFRDDPARRLVLISDLLSRPDAAPSADNLAKRCQEILGNYAFGTIAIMALPQRIPDIDRAIRPDTSRSEFERALSLTIGRLQYVAAPTKAPAAKCDSILVRPLRSTNEMEFRSYFALRHRVYTVMGYLDDEMERCRSGLEINEADLHAIHLGAFCRTGPQERLVGTARVVTNDEANMTLQRVFEGLVRNDPVVRHRLISPYLLSLPIFQSYDEMDAIMQEVFSRRQRCGEISRVIVESEFRGRGISRALVAEALRRSVDGGLERVFLECLKIHAGLYGRFGFQPIVEGPVVDVFRTMVAMELQPTATRKAVAAQASGEAERPIAWQGGGVL